MTTEKAFTTTLLKNFFHFFSIRAVISKSAVVNLCLISPLFAASGQPIMRLQHIKGLVYTC